MMRPSTLSLARTVFQFVGIALSSTLIGSGIVFVDSSSPASATGCLTEDSPPPGGGTSENPYLITTADQLAWIGQKANFLSGANDVRLEQRSACPERLTKHYRLTGDINLSGRAWSPIGQFTLVSEGGVTFSQENTEAFSGVFDGAGHTITGFSQLTTPTAANTGPALPSSPTDHTSAGSTALPTYGLFGWVRGTGSPNSTTTYAAIKNLTVEGARFTFDGVYGGDGAGILVGAANNAVLENVHTTGRIEGVGRRFGGLLGHSRSAAFTGFAVEAVHLLSATSAVDLVMVDSDSVGGLIGDFDANDSLVSDSFASGTVSGRVRVGGLIGRDDASNSTILKSGASGAVTGSGNDVGALVGEADSKYLYTFATGNARGTDEVGGLIGDMGSTTRIENSYARGNSVSTRSDPTEPARAGGLVGNIADRSRVIVRSFAAGSVSNSATPPIVNGLGAFAGSEIIGRALTDFAVTYSFVDATAAGSLPAIARATPSSEVGRVEIVNSAEMTSIDTYRDAGWAIVEGWEPFNAPDGGNAVQGTHQVWGICSQVNDGYPFLLWQYSSNPCVVGGGAGEASPRGGRADHPRVSSRPAIHLELKAAIGDPAAGAAVEVAGTGLLPGSTYTLVVRSTPQVLLSAPVGSSGTFGKTLRLPSLPGGNHVLTLTATGGDGSTLTLAQSFQVDRVGLITAISTSEGTVVGGLAATGRDQTASHTLNGTALVLMLLGTIAVLARLRVKNSAPS